MDGSKQAVASDRVHEEETIKSHGEFHVSFFSLVLYHVLSRNGLCVPRSASIRSCEAKREVATASFAKR